MGGGGAGRGGGGGLGAMEGVSSYRVGAVVGEYEKAAMGMIPVSVSVCLSLSVSVWLSVCLHGSLSVHLSVCLYICMSLCFFVCPVVACVLSLCPDVLSVVHL